MRFEKQGFGEQSPGQLGAWGGVGCVCVWGANLSMVTASMLMSLSLSMSLTHQGDPTHSKTGRGSRGRGWKSLLQCW